MAISPQVAAKNAEVKEKHRLEYPVLSDHGNEYAAKLGLRHDLPQDLREVYRGFGVDLAESNGEDSWTLPLATRIVVDQQGVIRALSCDPDYTIRPEPSATVGLLEGL